MRWLAALVALDLAGRALCHRALEYEPVDSSLGGKIPWPPPGADLSTFYPPDPSPSDPLVTSLTGLMRELNASIRCSIRLEGVFRLGDLPSSHRRTKLVFQNFVRAGGPQPVAQRCLFATLWSETSATLDAEGTGRVLSVS